MASAVSLAPRVSLQSPASSAVGLPGSVLELSTGVPPRSTGSAGPVAGAPSPAGATPRESAASSAAVRILSPITTVTLPSHAQKSPAAWRTGASSAES